jgi:predicted transcriptional regulator of viral defense system
LKRSLSLENNLPFLKTQLIKPGKIFSTKDLTDLYEKFKKNGLVSKLSNVQNFIELLLADKFLHLIPISGNSELVRYATGNVSPFEVALSVARPTAISHASALFFHGLSSYNPRIVYVTQEQSEKITDRVFLKQANVDAAFSKPQRQSKSIFKWSRYEIHLLKGKNSHGLGVQHLPFQDTKFHVIDIEKTLLDITVRPAYAGGVAKVSEAYKNARDKFSVEKLYDYLRKMKFVYPYHQLIGYYLQTNGYPEKDIELFRKIPRRIKFYLDYDIQNKSYNAEWQVYTPAEMVLK